MRPALVVGAMMAPKRVRLRTLHILESDDPLVMADLLHRRRQIERIERRGLRQVHSELKRERPSRGREPVAPSRSTRWLMLDVDRERAIVRIA